MDREKRRFPRCKCAGTAGVQVSVDRTVCCAEIVDLSVEGCLVVLEKPQRLTLDALVELTFNVNNLFFRVRGQVRSIRSRTSIGFQFPQLSKRVRQQLEDLVEELNEVNLKRASALKSSALTNH